MLCVSHVTLNPGTQHALHVLDSSCALPHHAWCKQGECPSAHVPRSLRSRLVHACHQQEKRYTQLSPKPPTHARASDGRQPDGPACAPTPASAADCVIVNGTKWAAHPMRPMQVRAPTTGAAATSQRPCVAACAYARCACQKHKRATPVPHSHSLLTQPMSRGGAKDTGGRRKRAEDLCITTSQENSWPLGRLRCSLPLYKAIHIHSVTAWARQRAAQRARNEHVTGLAPLAACRRRRITERGPRRPRARGCRQTGR